MECRIERVIAAPIAEVFARASDFANAAESIPAILSVEMLTDGEVGVGTRFKETRKMFGKEASEVMEVSSFQPPHSYELSATSHGCQYRTTLSFEEIPDGTRVSLHFEGRPLTLVAKIMSFLMRPMVRMMRKEMQGDLDGLAAACESSAPS